MVTDVPDWTTVAVPLRQQHWDVAHPALIMYVPAHRFVLGEFVAGDDGELTLEQLEVTTPFVLGHVDAKFERQPARLQELHEETEKLPTNAGEHDPPVLQQLQRQQSPLVQVEGLAVPTELVGLDMVDGVVVGVVAADWNDKEISNVVESLMTGVST